MNNNDTQKSNFISLSKYAHIVKLIPEKNSNTLYIERMIQNIKEQNNKTDFAAEKPN